MALFNKLLGKGNTPKSSIVTKKNDDIKEHVIYKQKYIQSHTFKGYKRFRLSYHGYEPAETGLALFKESGLMLDGAEIDIRFVRRGQFHFLDVRINDYLVGSVTLWDENDEVFAYVKNQFCTGKVKKAYIRIESEQDRVYLFLKADE